MLARQRSLVKQVRPPTERARLLIVDDDEGNSTLLNHLLHKDYDTVVVNNGKLALDRIATQTFDLVLLDIMMPVMNGLDVLRHLRADEDTADLPIILLSARADDRDIVQGLREGANDYITKPLSLDIVRARVQTHLKFKQLADAHKQTIHDLQIAQEMQEHFFRIVSHDLKGPLTNLRMATFLLREMTSDQPSVQEVMENVDTSLNEMQEMIRTFLDVAALQPGRLEMNAECFTTREALRRVLEQYKLAAMDKNVHVHIEPSEATIYADLRLYVQVLSNLVSNAIKYTPPGTNVHIWMEGDERWTRICVADQGAGIPENERDRLFQMFSKLSTRPTGGESSSGLGLWIVKMLTEAMGGAVGVECPADGGSIFYVDMPAC